MREKSQLLTSNLNHRTMSSKPLSSIPPAPRMPDAPKMPEAPTTGNIQVDGSAVHVNRAAEGRAVLGAQIDALARMEAKTVPGAPVLTPKERLLDARDLEAKDPDHHYRFVNTAYPEKVQGRLLEGYTRVPDAEGGRALGELALFKQPKAKYDERKAAEAKLTKQREHAHVHEVEQAVEGVARFLRDRYGLRVDPNRMIVKE